MQQNVDMPCSEVLQRIQNRCWFHQRIHQEMNVITHHNPGMEVVITQVPLRVSDCFGNNLSDLGPRQVMLIPHVSMEPPGDEEGFPARVPVRQIAAIESHAR